MNHKEINALESSGFLNLTGQTALIDSKPFTWWAEEFGLPLHIRSAEIIKGNIQAFKNVLKKYYPHSSIHFAAKAFPYPEMLKLIANEGIGIDAASYHEMRCALEAGVPPHAIGLNGNAKEDFMIKEAIGKDILIIADNIEELNYVNNIAQNMHKHANALLRVSGFNVGNVTADEVLTSNSWTKFGEHIDRVKKSMSKITSFSHINLQGFHAHVGSQITSLEPFQLVLGELIHLGHLLNAHGRACKIINIGGGYPISYFNQSEWNDFLTRIKQGDFLWHDKLNKIEIEQDNQIKHWIGEQFYTEFPKEKMLAALLQSQVMINDKSCSVVQALHDLGQPLLIIEPGRSIMGDSGLTLARVSHAKIVNLDHHLTILEMGITNLGEAFFGPSARKWTILTDHQLKDAQPFATFLAGNLCYSGDVFSPYKCLLQRKPQRDDIVMAHMTGAYDQYFFASNANAFARPPQLLSYGPNHIVTVKKRDTYEEITGVI
jgi:diaminopimelate decarboxylase